MALSDEAHARGILLPAVGQSGLFGDFTHLRFGQMADGKHRLFQSVLAEHIEEIALILVAIRAAQKLLHFSSTPQTVLAALLCLANLERSNIINIIEGVRYGLSPEQISAFLKY